MRHRGHRGPADRRLHQRLHDERAGAGASPTSPSAPPSTSSSCSASRWRTRPLIFIAFLAAPRVQLQLRPGPLPGVRPGPRARTSRSGIASALVGTDVHARRDRGRPVPLVRLPHGRGLHASRPLVLGVVEFATAIGTVDLRPRGPPGEAARGSIVGADRPRGLGDRHPPRAELRRGCSCRGSSCWRPAAFVANWAIIWMERALGFGSDEKGTWVTIILGATAVAHGARRPFPRRRSPTASGRKPVIWVGAAPSARSASRSSPSLRSSRSGLVGGVLVGVGSGHVPGRRLGAAVRARPEGVVGPLHGHEQPRDGAPERDRGARFGGLVLDVVANGFLGFDVDFSASARWAIGVGVLFYGVGATAAACPVKEPARRRTSGGALGAVGAAG